MKRIFAHFEKYRKKHKKLKKSYSSSSSDSSNSDWSKSLVGDKRDSIELFTRDLLGSGSSGHLLDPLVNVYTNKLSNDSICNEKHQLQLNQIKCDLEYLKNNLFVYNKSSCPVRLRKHIREQLEFSPEVAAILLPDVIGITNKSKKKAENGEE